MEMILSKELLSLALADILHRSNQFSEIEGGLRSICHKLKPAGSKSKKYATKASKLTGKYCFISEICFQIKKISEYFQKTRKMNSLRKIFLSLLQENLT